MPLTPRFEELVRELNLPDAAWHLSRTNAGTENHAEESEILEGRERVLRLLYNVDDCVTKILAETESELARIKPMETLLLQKLQWTPYDGDIARRLSLEKVRKQAQLILDWWLIASKTGTMPSPQSLFKITRNTDQENKIKDIWDRVNRREGDDAESFELAAA